MHKNKGIDKTLYLNAVLKLKFRIDINPLVIPQPKHEMLKIFFIGHREVEKIFVKINKAIKKTNPTIIECKVCLFRLLVFLILYQRLTITVSESTG